MTVDIRHMFKFSLIMIPPNGVKSIFFYLFNSILQNFRIYWHAANYEGVEFTGGWEINIDMNLKWHEIDVKLDDDC